MAFGIGKKSSGKSKERPNRSADQNNPSDNPKDRVLGEDRPLDKDRFETEEMKQRNQVETPGGDGRGLGLNFDD